jgi:GntR family transcriptional regulator/MocR family aminotransferase
MGQMELLITIDRQAATPIYRQIAEALQGLIRRGQFAPGARMPSTRDLALRLNVSRFTMEKVYQELARQGVVTPVRANGTFVNSFEPLPMKQPELQFDFSSGSEEVEPLLSRYGRRVLANKASAVDADQQSSMSEADLESAIAKWPEMLNRARKLFRASAKQQESFGHIGMRKVLADYLARTRGIFCSYKQIVIFNSKQSALDAVTRMLIDPGDAVAVEDPGCPGARKIFLSHGAALKTVPVDSYGMTVQEVVNSPIDLKLVYTSPTVQNPLGAQLSDGRKVELLSWAQQKGTFILEDDCGHEFRYNQRPLPALKASDRDNTMIYLSDFDGIMLSLFKAAYLVLPLPLVSVFDCEESLVQRNLCHLEHTAMELFMSEGHFDRHVRRVRIRYLRRRRMLIEKFNQTLGKIAAILSSGRTSLLVRFHASLDQDHILACAKATGLILTPTHPYYINDPRTNEVQLSFAHADEEVLEKQLADFAARLRPELAAAPAAQPPIFAMPPRPVAPTFEPPAL